MTYEEAVYHANKKLKGWDTYQDRDVHQYSQLAHYLSNEWVFEVNNPEGDWWRHDGLISMSFLGFDGAGGAVRVSRLEDFFVDPFNVSKEEVELFKLEYGFIYPKELIVTCEKV